jgi:competence protein ComEC
MPSRHISDDIEKFFRKTPFFRFLLALISGIVFQIAAGYYFSIFITTFLLGIALILSGFIYKKAFRFRWIFGLGLSLWLFSAGLFLTEKADEHTRFAYIGEEHTYIAEIISPPSEKSRSVLYELLLISNIDKDKRLDNNVLGYFAKDSLSLSLQAGEHILLNAVFEKAREFGNPYEFDYPRYLKYKGISATSHILVGNWKKLDENAPFSIVNLAIQSRDKLLSIYKNLGISGDEYGVLAALTLGYRDELSQDLELSYAAAGVTHVLSVSGMHVGVIFIVLEFLLAFMNRKRSSRILKAVIIIVFLWFYSFMTGLTPSVVRSALMLSLIVFSKVINRNSDTYNTVFISAFFMLIYNPYYLFDVGFQLSYLAVLGIVYFQPKLMGLWKTNNKFLKPLWSLLTVSLAAQIVTTPLSLYYFHNFPNYFWVSNLIIVPISSLIIYLAFGLLFFYQIPYLNDFVTIILTWTVKITNETIVFIHNLPYSQLKNVWLEGWQLAAICFVIILLAIAVIYKHSRALFCALVLTTVLFSLNLYSEYQASVAGNKLIAASMQNGYAVSFINGTTSYLLSNNEEESFRALSPYYMKHKIYNTTVWYNSDGFVSFGGKRIYVLSENIFDKKTTGQILNLDYLILTNNVKVSISQITKFFAPEQIIIDKSYRKYSMDRLKNDCALMGINCYSMENNGAFIAEWD